MRSRYRNIAAILAVCALGIAGVAAARHGTSRELRICADPNNLPFSNNKQEGFENRLAELVARELQARLRYTWWAQRRGFLRNTLNAGECDLVMGVPAGLELAATTTPYYRSTYVFVSRNQQKVPSSLDDPLLRTARVGVQLIGDDATNSPPAHALGRRGIVENVAGFSVVGDYSRPNPPARIIDALSAGEIDIAIAWGPMAGYFARRQKLPLRLDPVNPPVDAGLPMQFAISMAVRRDEQVLLEELERIIAAKRQEIRRILESYGVPLL